MPNELFADYVEASESHNDNDNGDGIGNDIYIMVKCLSVCLSVCHEK